MIMTNFESRFYFEQVQILLDEGMTACEIYDRIRVEDPDITLEIVCECCSINYEEYVAEPLEELGDFDDFDYNQIADDAFYSDYN
jgi:hypothetical protein